MLLQHKVLNGRTHVLKEHHLLRETSLMGNQQLYHRAHSSESQCLWCVLRLRLRKWCLETKISAALCDLAAPNAPTHGPAQSDHCIRVHFFTLFPFSESLFRNHYSTWTTAGSKHVFKIAWGTSQKSLNTSNNIGALGVLSGGDIEAPTTKRAPVLGLGFCFKHQQAAW